MEETALEALEARTGGDPEARKCVGVLRRALREKTRLVRELQTVLANQKAEMYEDPIAVHEMHLVMGSDGAGRGVLGHLEQLPPDALAEAGGVLERFHVVGDVGDVGQPVALVRGGRGG